MDGKKEAKNWKKGGRKKGRKRDKDREKKGEKENDEGWKGQRERQNEGQWNRWKGGKEERSNEGKKEEEEGGREEERERGREGRQKGRKEGKNKGKEEQSTLMNIPVTSHWVISYSYHMRSEQSVCLDLSRLHIFSTSLPAHPLIFSTIWQTSSPTPAFSEDCFPSCHHPLMHVKDSQSQGTEKHPKSPTRLSPMPRSSGATGSCHPTGLLGGLKRERCGGRELPLPYLPRGRGRQRAPAAPSRGSRRQRQLRAQ